MSMPKRDYVMVVRVHLATKFLVNFLWYSPTASTWFKGVHLQVRNLNVSDVFADMCQGELVRNVNKSSHILRVTRSSIGRWSGPEYPFWQFASALRPAACSNSARKPFDHLKFEWDFCSAWFTAVRAWGPYRQVSLDSKQNAKAMKVRKQI